MSLGPDAKAWIYEQLLPTEKQNVLLRAGVKSGPASQVSQFGGPAEFWGKLQLHVHVEDAAVWVDMPVIRKFVAIALLASKLSPDSMQVALGKLGVSDGDAVRLTGAGYTLSAFYEAVKDAPKETWNFCPGHAELVERIYA